MLIRISVVAHTPKHLFGNESDLKKATYLNLQLTLIFYTKIVFKEM